jgi:hypothetical protein
MGELPAHGFHSSVAVLTPGVGYVLIVHDQHEPGYVELPRYVPECSVIARGMPDQPDGVDTRAVASWKRQEVP